MGTRRFLEAGDSVVGYYQVWTFRGSSVIRNESIREREEPSGPPGSLGKA